jgi:hypothetical protein
MNVNSEFLWVVFWFKYFWTNIHMYKFIQKYIVTVGLTIIHRPDKLYIQKVLTASKQIWQALNESNDFNLRPNFVAVLGHFE